MATTGQITLWLLVVATLLALVAVILVAIDIAQNRTVTTGTTGATGAGVMDIQGTTASVTSSLLQAGALMGGPGTSFAYGNGSAGDALFEGQTGLVLTADAQYRNLTLNNSILDTNGYRLFCAGSLTLTGGSVIQARGGPGLDNSYADDGWVDGGWGGSVGTLGGGGNGGYGALAMLASASLANADAMNGAASTHALWGNDTSLFVGGNATTSPYAGTDQYAGQAGAVLSDRTRVFYEAIQALNPASIPTTPLLSGGSGGGGGHGLGANPGSGGGGGGGVVVIGARQLIVPIASGATVDVSGGNAGAMVTDCCSTGTSGGGGGGGLILIATDSAPGSYAGLTLNVSGGLSVDSNSNALVAAPGRAVFWFNQASSASNQNPNAFIDVVASTGQSVPNNTKTTVAFNAVRSSLGMAFDATAGSLTALSSGIYILNASLAVSPAASLSGWFRRNQDDSIKHGANSFSGPYITLGTRIHLDVGDSIDVQLLQTSGASITIGTASDAPSTFSAQLSLPQFGSS